MERFIKNYIPGMACLFKRHGLHVERTAETGLSALLKIEVSTQSLSPRGCRQFLQSLQKNCCSNSSKDRGY